MAAEDSTNQLKSAISSILFVMRNNGSLSQDDVREITKEIDLRLRQNKARSEEFPADSVTITLSKKDHIKREYGGLKQ